MRIHPPLTIQLLLALICATATAPTSGFYEVGLRLLHPVSGRPPFRLGVSFRRSFQPTLPGLREVREESTEGQAVNSQGELEQKQASAINGLGYYREYGQAQASVYSLSRSPAQQKKSQSPTPPVSNAAPLSSAQDKQGPANFTSPRTKRTPGVASYDSICPAPATGLEDGLNTITDWVIAFLLWVAEKGIILCFARHKWCDCLGCS